MFILFILFLKKSKSSVHKNSQMMATKWKNGDRKFNNNKFHSRWGKKTIYLFIYHKKCSKFHRRDSLHERVFQLIIYAKAKAWVFPRSFAVILSAVALPIMLKAEFNFELICTLPFLFSKVQAAALNPLSIFKTLLKAHRLPCFRRRWGKEKLFKEKFEGSVHLDLPFWGHLNID